MWSKEGGAMNTELENATDGIIDSTGNVFADLGRPADEEHMLKVKIAQAIGATIKKRGLNQKAAGDVIGVDQAKVSALLRGQLRAFSVERLMKYLMLLGRDIDVKISREHAGRHGRIRVTAVA
jgi:predicted XRE-type DNA-binding protein